MLADQMQELWLAGERFVRVRDWQSDQIIPKYINVPANVRVQLYDERWIDTGTLGKPLKNVKVYGVMPWINKDGSYNQYISWLKVSKSQARNVIWEGNVLAICLNRLLASLKRRVVASC